LIVSCFHTCHHQRFDGDKTTEKIKISQKIFTAFLSRKTGVLNVAASFPERDAGLPTA
jgi:hypothetical protein